MASKVSVVIPTFRREEALRATVADLLRQTHPAHQIIVVDNAPPDHRSFPDFLRDDPRIAYVTADPAGNANAARNAGVRTADGEFILLLDDDLSLPADCLAQFLAVHGEGWDVVHGNLTERGRSLVVPAGIRGNRPLWRILRHRHGEERGHTIAVSSGFTSIRRSVLDAIGGLDESFPFHYDDYDLGVRLWFTGATMIHDPRPRGEHLRAQEGRSDRRGDPGAVATAKYRFLRKHFTRRACRVELATDVLLMCRDCVRDPVSLVRGVHGHLRAYRRSRSRSASS